MLDARKKERLQNLKTNDRIWRPSNDDNKKKEGTLKRSHFVAAVEDGDSRGGALHGVAGWLAAHQDFHQRRQQPQVAEDETVAELRLHQRRNPNVS